MPRQMSETLKRELALRLGILGTVEQEGWGGVSARDCGRLVREALKVAESELARQENVQGTRMR
jgi:small acid-soluble spore protein F (minor alpha/beta-type SASP)